MISCIRLALSFLFLETAAARKLSYAKIAGFEPRSSATDVNAIDLDFKAIEAELAFGTKDSFTAAQKIYEEGGYSLSFATLSIVGTLPFAVTKGDKITGSSSTQISTYGVALEDAPQGSATLKFQYDTTDIPETYSNCQVGGLVNPNVAGCLNATGTITVEDSNTPIQYSYIPETDNNNARTLKSLSANSEATMKSSQYYSDFQQFVDYYGTPQYADEFITAALAGTATGFTNGNADFSLYDDYTGRAEAVEKGIQYQSTAMYSILQMEFALDNCNKTCTADSGCDDLKYLDSAVAFYTGSLQGADGSGAGVLMYSLANKRCVDFKTCGESASEVTGTSRVNLNIMMLFKQMQENLLKDLCAAARKDKEKIVTQMVIPLIQGTLRYARITESDPDSGDKGEVEGASFAAAVLPFIDNCDPKAASTIYNNMKTGQGKTAKLASVKQAFESTYGCLGITCGDVGGLWDAGSNKYYPGGEPCNGGPASTSDAFGTRISLSLLCIAIIPMILVLF